MGKILDTYYSELDYIQKLDISQQNLDFETNRATEKLKNFIPFGNQFIYGARFPDLKYFYTSPSVENVLGFLPEDFKGPDDFFGLVHPDDIEYVLIANLKALSLGADLKNIHELQHLFNIDFRIRKKNGEYIRVLRQSGLLTKTKEGKLATTFAVVTDISYLKDSNKIILKMNGPEIPGYEFQIENKQNKLRFSKQEKIIIDKIMMGKNSREIAEELHISVETVYTHRRKMLKKANMKSTAELISWVLKNVI